MKSKKTMSFKNIIVDAILLICPILIYIFMSQPYLAVSGRFINESLSNGYELIDFSGKGAADFNAVCLILTCVFAAILILVAILALLRDFSVIKSAKFDKLFEIIKIVSILMLLLTTMASLITICSEFTVQTEISSVVAGWAVIVNMIVAFVLVFTYLVYLIGCLRKKK